MGIKADGTGEVLFRVTSTTIKPPWVEYPLTIPPNPPADPIQHPETTVANFTPVADPTNEVDVSGGFTVTTPMLDAFTVGDTFTLKIEKKPPPTVTATK